MRVPFLDVGAAATELRAELEATFARVVASGWYLLGSELAAFEGAFAAYVGSAHCVGVASGLDALHLALRAMGVGRGDEVIVPAHTAVATWLGVVHAGAVPVPVDVDPHAYTLDPSLVPSAVSRRTRAIVPVHLYGQSADMDPLVALARERGLAVLEDAAQAHGARYRGRRVGTMGDAAAWSFYPSKNLGALGDGGAVTTEDARVAERLRVLRNYGQPRKNEHEVPGFNSRLDEIQAAVLQVKLGRLDEWNARRAEIAAAYSEGLSGTSVGLPFVPVWAQPAWHLFVVRTRERERLRRAMEAAGVATAVHYPVPPHRQTAFESLGYRSLPVTDVLAREVVSLPMGPHLSKQDVARTIAAVRSFDVAGG